MLKNKKNEKFTDYFFKNHKLFVYNNYPGNCLILRILNLKNTQIYKQE